MKISIERDILLKSLNHIQSVVERRNTIPILSNVKVISSDSGISLTATDLDLEIIEQDIIDYISLIGTKTGAKVEVISGKAEYGSMLGSLGKIGALLRYNPNHS